MVVRINQNKILMLDFSCYLPDGRKVRCRESAGLKDTEKNRKIVQAKDKAIKYELKYGRFDYLHFFPHGAKASLFQALKEDSLFSHWWEQWLSEKTLRTKTITNWSSVYRVHLGPYFGHYHLSQIDEHEILIFRKALEIKGLRPNTINDVIIKPLCMCLGKAFKRGLIAEHPCREIRPLSEPPVDIQPFSFDELTLLLNTAKEKYSELYPMLLFWSRTGLRPGELFALKWQNIDKFNRKALIRSTMLSSGSEGPPKTRHSVRDVDLGPMAMEALSLQEYKTLVMDSYVFMSRPGRPFSDVFMRKKFRHILRLAGFSYRPPKQMRHTFATLNIAAGENISWVSRMLGHASVETTLRKYNRFIPNVTREDGSAFESMMSAKIGIFKALSQDK